MMWKSCPHAWLTLRGVLLAGMLRHGQRVNVAAHGHHARISYAVVFNPELVKISQDIPFLGSIICLQPKLLLPFAVLSMTM